MNEALFKFNGDFHKNVVIETTQSKDDGTEKFTAGSINTFRKFTIGDIVGGGNTVVSYLPDESYQFINQEGVTGFTYSSINPTTNAFVFDANYPPNPNAKIKKYNTRGVPEVVTDNSRIPKTILHTTLVTSVKVAEFTNAESANVGYSNFDGVFTGNFTTTGTAST